MHRFVHRLLSFFVLVNLGLATDPLLETSYADDDRPSQPNIVFILVDDLGKEWISCYGAEGIETPNIDNLAENGMRFEKAWCMPQCTPTRVTLFTGQYPFRHGWTNHFDVPRWGSGAHFDAGLNASFAKALNDDGYATAIAGKWQIDDFRVEPFALAEAGFDEWCVWTGGEGENPQSNERYWSPYVFEGSRQEAKPSRIVEERFGPDVYCDFLIDFMRRHRDQPQLIYFPMCLTHGPLVPTPDEPNAESAIDRHRAMVRYTDRLVGRVIDTLEELEMVENTLVIFTTDNGTSRGITGRRLGMDVQGAKAQMVEAGTAIPFIAYGPGMVPEGVVSEALTDFSDVLPTFADVAGVDLPRDWVIDGQSIASVIFGESELGPREWTLSVGGHPAGFRDGRVVPAQTYDDRVIRDHQWKLWVGEDRQPTMLFNLAEDPWEQDNLIDDPQESAREARERLWAIIESMPEVDASPIYSPNPAQSWDKFPFENER